MNLYYWNVKNNFGDLLSSFLIKRFCHLDSKWSQPKEAELVMCGSILEHLPVGWEGIIAGAGKLHEETKLKFNANILALRGYLTAKGIKGSFALGDPGLLANELVPVQEKKYNLGIVPHWTDKTLEHNKIFKQFSPKIIRVTDPPLKVIEEIGQCKKIVSSSLHGIILADAFNIPRRIEMAPRMISHPKTEGGTFKWRDYLSSIDEILEIGVTKEGNYNKITDVQHELFDVFEEIGNIFN